MEYWLYGLLGVGGLYILYINKERIQSQFSKRNTLLSQTSSLDVPGIDNHEVELARTQHLEDLRSRKTSLEKKIAFQTQGFREELRDIDIKIALLENKPDKSKVNPLKQL